MRNWSLILAGVLAAVPRAHASVLGCSPVSGNYSVVYNSANPKLSPDPPHKQSAVACGQWSQTVSVREDAELGNVEISFNDAPTFWTAVPLGKDLPRQYGYTDSNGVARNVAFDCLGPIVMVVTSVVEDVPAGHCASLVTCTSGACMETSAQAPARDSSRCASPYGDYVFDAQGTCRPDGDDGAKGIRIDANIRSTNTSTLSEVSLVPAADPTAPAFPGALMFKTGSIVTAAVSPNFVLWRRVDFPVACANSTVPGSATWTEFSYNAAESRLEACVRSLSCIGGDCLNDSPSPQTPSPSRVSHTTAIGVTFAATAVVVGGLAFVAGRFHATRRQHRDGFTEIK
jgi:hypothetical protein